MQKFVIGVDEVGRGPLAGPLCVGAFLLPLGLHWKDFVGLKDSKQLSAQKREEWATRVKKDNRLLYATAMVSASMIDDRGISFAARTAVKIALKKLGAVAGFSIESCEVLLDAGLRAPDTFKNQRSIIKGDEKEVSIALASIMAKVRRDAYMVRMADVYPSYDFATHKGYGTLTHRRSIKKEGLCKLHRRSFCTRLHVRQN